MGSIVRGVRGAGEVVRLSGERNIFAQ